MVSKYEDRIVPLYFMSMHIHVISFPVGKDLVNVKLLRHKTECCSNDKENNKLIIPFFSVLYRHQCREFLQLLCRLGLHPVK